MALKWRFLNVETTSCAVVCLLDIIIFSSRSIFAGFFRTKIYHVFVEQYKFSWKICQEKTSLSWNISFCWMRMKPPGRILKLVEEHSWYFWKLPACGMMKVQKDGGLTLSFDVRITRIKVIFNYKECHTVKSHKLHADWTWEWKAILHTQHAWSIISIKFSRDQYSHGSACTKGSTNQWLLSYIIKVYSSENTEATSK